VNHPKTKEAIYIDDFDYDLPDERIAKYPLQQRDSSKLLLWRNDELSESRFSEIASFLPENSLLVCNNTRVIQARIVFHKPTGARIEVFCLEPLLPSDYALSLSATGSCEWKCMVGNLKKWKEGALEQAIIFDGKDVTFSAELMETEGNTHRIRFSWSDDTLSFSEILMLIGELPIPPYLHRKTEENDKKTYQTVYSKIEGSVAAPTAGLHFTPEVFDKLKSKNIETEELTLHVGAGTFQPVKSATIDTHTMHTETIAVPLDTIRRIQRKLGNIIAVGTTSVRTLESLYYLGKGPLNPPSADGDLLNIQVSQWEPYENTNDIPVETALQNIIDYLEKNDLDTLHAETQILIKPGFQFRIINGMITNFHQPKSTLLLLVSAFVDGNWRKIYDYALSNDFRFLSYGDSSLLMK
jgi:S-adenosylmethionine:tRNA ribosyltransferase-isomerase